MTLAESLAGLEQLAEKATSGPLPDWFMERVRVDESGCWIWTGNLAVRGGYGLVWREQKKQRAHRVAFSLAGGTLLPGHVVHHRCETKPCVNPEHLEQIQFGQHTILHVRGGIWRTHCPRGHELTPENTHKRGDGYKCCRTCIADNEQIVRETYGPDAQCDAGHALTADNVFFGDGKPRGCHICQLRRQREWHAVHARRRRPPDSEGRAVTRPPVSDVLPRQRMKGKALSEP